MGLPKLKSPTYQYDMVSTGETIKFRPFTVKEEKILLMAYQADSVEEQVNHIAQIIENCTFGKMTADTAVFDFEAIFVQIRGKSIGEIIDVKYACGSDECDKTVPIKINTDTIALTRNPDHNKTIKLSDGVGLVMRYPCLSDMMHPVESEYDRIFNCIESIFDENEVYDPKDFSAEELNEFNDSLDTKQKEKLLGFLNTMPTLTHEVEYECECGHKDKVTLKGLRSFF